MAKQVTAWKTKGMNQDLSVSAFSSDFSFENRNLRLSTNENNTQLSWVNEKGTSKVGFYTSNTPIEGYTWNVTSIQGTVIGTAVINHQLVLFTTSSINGINTDRIYLFKYLTNSNEISGRVLYNGDLNFSVNNPIETLVSYESEMIQKVYWTDGLNQPRMINVAADQSKLNDWGNDNNCPFDFVNTLELNETIEVQKLLGASGTFPPGVIQYAFTYYNKYGQETSIFNVTPLYYISHKDRGASPDETTVENAFRITVNNPDTNFDYLRIYSIQRTSINLEPIVKRIQDISLKDIEDNKVSFLDVGTTGETVDPMSLLYKGGETIIAETLEQKDNTLFLGNLKSSKERIENVSREEIEEASSTGKIIIGEGYRSIYINTESSGAYTYGNQLTAYADSNKTISVPCNGFMKGETYRLGMQFQYKTGKWSDPIWIEDSSIYMMDFLFQNDHIDLPIFIGTLERNYAKTFIDAGYKRVRAVAVFPGIQDRNIICQGVVCPTVYTENHRNADKDIYAQSSWFFRPSIRSGGSINTNGTVYPVGGGELYYNRKGVKRNVPVDGDTPYNPMNIRMVEIEGDFEDSNRFKIDAQDVVTFHSPDVEFDPQLSVTDYQNFVYDQVGQAHFDKTLSDILIQTETPTISNSGGGFIHKSFTSDISYGIVSGLFYDDFIVDEMKDEKDSMRKFKAYQEEKSPVKWMVYPWQADGSLNNDINRAEGYGVSTAELKKKVISNLRFTSTIWNKSLTDKEFKDIQLYNSEEATIIKLNDKIYQGNLDTVLNPDYADGKYFACNSTNFKAANITTPFDSGVYYKLFSRDPNDTNDQGVWRYTSNGEWYREEGEIGDQYPSLVMKKGIVRMKYKSTSHLAIASMTTPPYNYDTDHLPIINIKRSNDDPAISMRFGGTSSDALKENTWIPCGEPVVLSTTGDTKFYYSYGDTYFQRWDCLKTYPFTREDKNQIVEIGSFMLATRVNIDGRYDRNRGQLSNINMSPVNFNLLNPIYSQQDNFFNYKIMDEDAYKDNYYPNQLTWTLTKISGADVDNWTTVTLANMLELDGDKGEITSLNRFNDQLIAFQDSGVSQILYNENVQVASTNGVPIEIANSGKVQGNRYFTDTVGCSNKWSIVQTPSGLYFMDSNSKNIYLFNGQLANISVQGGFNTWCKDNIPSSKVKWTPQFQNNSFVGYYDKKNNDVMYTNIDTTLAWSEKFSTFTSFYDYGNSPYFINLDDKGLWITNTGVNTGSFHEHHAGEYCDFFGVNKPFSITLIGNPEPLTDKTFTNLEFRANVDSDGEYARNTDKFTSILPFDSLEVWDDYQHGIAYLKNKVGSEALRHHSDDNTSALKRRMRIWRCDVPRDNAPLDASESLRGIFRSRPKPMDRIRNPWVYLKLQKDAVPSVLDKLKRTEIHDITLTYYN